MTNELLESKTIDELTRRAVALYGVERAQSLHEAIVRLARNASSVAAYLLPPGTEPFPPAPSPTPSTRGPRVRA